MPVELSWPAEGFTLGLLGPPIRSPPAALWSAATQGVLLLVTLGGTRADLVDDASVGERGRVAQVATFGDIAK